MTDTNKYLQHTHTHGCDHSVQNIKGSSLISTDQKTRLMSDDIKTRGGKTRT